MNLLILWQNTVRIGSGWGDLFQFWRKLFWLTKFWTWLLSVFYSATIFTGSKNCTWCKIPIDVVHLEMVICTKRLKHVKKAVTAFDHEKTALLVNFTKNIDFLSHYPYKYNTFGIRHTILETNLEIYCYWKWMPFPDTEYCVILVTPTVTNTNCRLN